MRSDRSLTRFAGMCPKFGYEFPSGSAGSASRPLRPDAGSGDPRGRQGFVKVPRTLRGPTHRAWVGSRRGEARSAGVVRSRCGNRLVWSRMRVPVGGVLLVEDPCREKGVSASHWLRRRKRDASATGTNGVRASQGLKRSEAGRFRYGNERSPCFAGPEEVGSGTLPLLGEGSGN